MKYGKCQRGILGTKKVYERVGGMFRNMDVFSGTKSVYALDSRAATLGFVLVAPLDQEDAYVRIKLGNR